MRRTTLSRVPSVRLNVEVLEDRSNPSTTFLTNYLVSAGKKVYSSDTVRNTSASSYFSARFQPKSVMNRLPWASTTPCNGSWRPAGEIFGP